MSFKDLIDRWPTKQALLRDINAQGIDPPLHPMVVAGWWRRNMVPVEYWAPIQKAAEARGKPITDAELVAAAKVAPARTRINLARKSRRSQGAAAGA